MSVQNIGIDPPVDQTELFQKFRELLGACCHIIQGAGVKIQPYHQFELPHFARLNPIAQEASFRALELYRTTLERASDDLESRWSSDRMLWHALSILKLLPQNDFFRVLDDDTVVEIYDLEGVQIWRNFNFLKICSYSLEEMYSIPWTERYRRSEVNTQMALEKVGLLLSGKTPDFYHAAIPEHDLFETLSERRLFLKASHEYLARLYSRDGRLKAWAGFSKVKIAGEQVRIAPQLATL